MSSVVALEPIQAGEVLVSLPPGSFIPFGSRPFAPSPGQPPLLSAALQLLSVRIFYTEFNTPFSNGYEADEFILAARAAMARHAAPGSNTPEGRDAIAAAVCA